MTITWLNVKKSVIKRNLIGEKRVGELSEEGFQKHRSNMHILIRDSICMLLQYDDDDDDAC